MGVNIDAKDNAATVKVIPYKSICVFVLIVDGVLLFAPENVVAALGLNQVRETIKPYLGILFLCAAAILLIDVGGSWIRRKVTVSRYRGKNAKRILDRLSKRGKQVVRRMYESESHTAYLSITDATATYLQRSSIIGQTTASNNGEYFDRYLQPWVVEYLDKHPDYLREMPEPDEGAFECEGEF